MANEANILKAEIPLTLQQETEDVEEEEYADAVEICEERLVVQNRQSVGGYIADYVGDADDDQEDRVHQTGHDEQGCPAKGRAQRSALWVLRFLLTQLCTEE